MFKHIVKVAPTDAELDSIEQIVIVDEVPPATALGAGSLSLIIVGETETGVFTPQRITSTNDYLEKYGALGWTTAEGKYQGAVARRSGGSRAWAGNIWMYRKKKSYAGLVVTRVDGSAGSVQFRRLAAIRGGKGPFNIEPGDSVTFQRNGGTDVSTTINATAARILGQGGTFPTGFVGGEDLLIQIDQDDPIPIIFGATEQSLAQVIAHGNAKAAVDIFSNVGGELAIDSVVRGTAGRIRILGGSALATLGHVSTAVADVWTYTIVQAQVGAYVLRVTRVIDGVSTNYDIPYTSATTDEPTFLTELLAEAQDAEIPGATWSEVGSTLVLTADANVLFTAAIVQTEVSAGDITGAVHTDTGQTTDQYGTGDVPDIDFIEASDAGVVFGDMSGLDAYVDSDGYLWVVNAGTPATGKLQATAGVYEAFGFDSEVVDAADAAEVTLKAGVRVKDNTTGTVWVTMEDVATTTAGGPFSVKVRPWEDTDTAVASAIAGIDEVVDEMPGFWSVTNAAVVTRLTASQLEARYKQAIDKTLDVSSEAAECSIIVAARHSVNIAGWLRENANAASENGCKGRTAITALPVESTRAQALAAVATLRDDRAIFTFPGVRILSEEVLEVGAAGGIGFSNDGLIEQTFDSWYAYLRTKIRPEQSAGEIPSETNAGLLSIASLEADYESALGGLGLEEADYVIFKAQGIAAPRRTTLGYVVQSDVTSVLRSAQKARAPANRRFFSDQVADELYNIALIYKDKLAFPGTITALKGRLNGYLKGLANPANPRILGSSIRLDSTPAQLAAGLVIWYPKVQMAPHIQAMLFKLQVGAEGVTIDQVE